MAERLERPVGFSTGALYKLNLSLGQSIKVISELGSSAIELSFLKIINPDLEMRRGDARVDSLDSFSHVSLHAPLMKYDGGELSATVLRRLMHLQQHNFDKNVSLIVFHPDTVIDFGSLASALIYKGTIAFENMDARKQSFRGVEEMFYLLRFHPNFRMCLDVAHALSNNQGLTLAESFMEVFGSKIKQVHLSGMDGGSHALLFKTKQVELIKQALDANAPIIIESPVESLGEMEQEYEYVVRTLAALQKRENLREKHVEPFLI